MSKKGKIVTLAMQDLTTLLRDVGFEPIPNGKASVSGVSSFDRSVPETLVFWKFDAPPSMEQSALLANGVVVLALPLIANELFQRGVTSLGVSDPRAAFAVVSAYFTRDVTQAGVHPTAVIDSMAQIDISASIGAGSVVGAGCIIGPNSRIGSHCVIYPGVTVHEEVDIGDLSVVGAPGFGYVTLPSGSTMLIPHIGSVQIHRGAHIGSHVAIDRGTIDDTVIGENARIDNLVHIAHNVQVGANAKVMAGAEVSGGVIIGEWAWIAPQASIREQVVIGAGATVGIGSAVVRNVRPGSTVTCVPARELPADQ